MKKGCESMVIQHNMAALLASSKVNINGKSNASSAEKLSSGYRINRAADDAAGLTISEKMRWQIRGLDRASKNIEDGMSLIQVADGALNESHAVLQRMNELAVQAANDTNTDVDRDAIQLEMDDLSEELTRIAETTTFNDKIYPLASEGVQKVQFPSGISAVTLKILNDTGSDVTCNGVTYKDGETMVLDNAAWHDGGWQYSAIISVGFTGVAGLAQVKNCQVTQSLSYMCRNFKKPTNAVLSYATINDVQADENGTTSGTPLPEKCEAANCLRMEKSNATKPDEIKIQSGALAYQSVDIPLVNATAEKLGVGNLDVMTHTYASKAITTINNAIAKVSEYRSTFGACQNRLEHAKANVDNIQENTQDAESTLRDTDMAEEMVRNSTTSILAQVGQSVLAQESKTPEAVLKLLQ